MSSLTLLQVNFTKVTPQILKEQERKVALNNDIRRKKTFREEEAEQVHRNLTANADLEQGKILPEYLQGDVPEDCHSIPLIDPDPYYDDKNTYIILNDNYSIYRFSATRALLCFSPLHIVRRIANRILIHPYFNNFIMLTILVNCFFMALNTEDLEWESHAELTFLLIYTFEAVVKLVSRGFVYPHFTYMRDAWNLLDIAVIMTAYVGELLVILQVKVTNLSVLRALRVLRALKAIASSKGDFKSTRHTIKQANCKLRCENFCDKTYLSFSRIFATLCDGYADKVIKLVWTTAQDVPGVAALRAFRVLRALKAISTIPGLKAIVSALIESVKALKDVMILTLFCLAVFALIGLQLFMGSLSQKCIITWPPGNNATLMELYVSNNLTEDDFPVPLNHILDSKLNKSQFAYKIGDGEYLTYEYLHQKYNDSTYWPEGHLVSLPMTCGDPPEKLNCSKDHRGWYNESYRDWLDDECNYCYVNEVAWLCGNGSGTGLCQDGYTCYREGENPNFGYTNYDNFYYAFLALFRLMAQDYWESLYQLTIRANGQVYLLFFMFVIFLGSFYLVNLILAVVAMAYEEQHQIVAAEEERKKALVLKKKQELEAIVEEVTRAESRLQSRRASHATNQRSSGCSSPATPRSSLRSSERFRKRMRSTSQKEKREKEEAARQTANKLAVEVGMNGGVPPQIIKSHPSAEMISEAVAKLSQEEVKEDHDLLAPVHPHGILKSGGSSPRPSLRSIQVSPTVMRRVFPVDDDDDDDDDDVIERRNTLKERKKLKDRKRSGASLLGWDSDFADDEQSEKLSLSELPSSRRISGNSVEVPQSHVTYANQKAWGSSGTMVDRNGVVSLANRNAHGLPEVIVVRAKSEPDLKIFLLQDSSLEFKVYKIEIQDIENTLSIDSDSDRMDTLHPFGNRSRLPSLDLLSEPDLAMIKRRALSHASIIASEMADQDRRCPPCFYINTRKYCIWECCKCWGQVQRFMNTICTDPFFDLFIILCILVNTGFLAADYEPMPPESRTIFNYSNYFFTTVFCMEMVIKIIGMNPYYYFQDTWNCFDAVIVCFSLFELLLANVKGFSILRTFRLMRVFKLAKSWPTLNTLIKIIGNSLGSLGNLTFILIIILFIFAVVGKQLFREMYSTPDENHTEEELEEMRWHMKNFGHSFLIVFRILCGEWIETMWDCMRFTNSISNLCVPVFMLVQVIGNLVVLNLFLALLLSSFSADTFSISSEEDQQPNPVALSKLRIKRWVSCLKSKFRSCKEVVVQSCRRKLRAPAAVLDSNRRNQNSRKMATNDTVTVLVEISDGTFVADTDGLDGNGARNVGSNLKSFDNNGYEMNKLNAENVKVPRAALESDFEHCDSEEDNDDNSSLCSSRHSYSSDSSSCTTSTISNSEYERRQANKENETIPSDGGNADEPSACWPDRWIAKFPCLNPPVEVGCGRTWWNARKICFRIVEHPWFETFIILMILLSSGALAFEDVHYHDRKSLGAVLRYADRIFTYVFIFEMLLKWVGYGFKKYFTNAWCWLDFIIVGISLVGLVADWLGMAKIPSIRSLRTLRALRPLRAMSRFEGMKVVVNALIGAIPSIFNVLLVCLIFWLIFSIVGVNFFSGTFWQCVSNATGSEERLPRHNFNQTFGGKLIVFEEINKTTCHMLNNITPNIRWKNAKLTFDSSLAGYLSLLQVATFKGWMDIMYSAVDATGIDEQPEFESNFFSYYYFVAFIVFGSFFTLNLFIGVIIDNFNQQKKKLGGQDIFMTEEQRKYYNAMKKLGSKKPQKPVPRPKNKLQAWVFDIVTHQMFEITIMILIVANMATMMIEYYKQPDSFTDVLEYVNYVFVAIFTGEALIKMFALRHHYFKNVWNVFDFVVVILSIVGSTMSELIKEYFVQPTLFRIIRLARIGRILRLIKGAKGIRTLLFALMMSLPALINIGLLLVLVMFIYSIFGMSQFAFVHRGSGIDDLFNFETFFSSFLCLFMITTSAGWAELLSPMLDQPPDCNPELYNGNPNGRGDCGNSTVAVAFFVSYLIFTFLIVVNMYIAIILENFGVATEESTDPLGEDDFEMFYEVWERFDPKATQFIDYASLSDFVDSLADPLRVPKPNSRDLIAMDLPMVINDRLHCLDVLFALTKKVLGESDELEGLRSQMEEKFMASNPSKVSYEPITTTLKRKQEEMSAIKIQRWWRTISTVRALMSTPQPDKRKDKRDDSSPGSDGSGISESQEDLERDKYTDTSPPGYDKVMNSRGQSRYKTADNQSICEVVIEIPPSSHAKKNNFETDSQGSPPTNSIEPYSASASIPHCESLKQKSGSNENGSSELQKALLDIQGLESLAALPTDSDAENNNDGRERNANLTFMANAINNEFTENQTPELRTKSSSPSSLSPEHSQEPSRGGSEPNAIERAIS